MPPISRSNVILIGAAVFIVIGATAALAGPSMSPSHFGRAARSPLILAESKAPIDESCLMVCIKWNGDNCEKFEQKCKGDPGYPTAKGSVTKARPGNAGVKAP
jgi:hypothetical protein